MGLALVHFQKYWLLIDYLDTGAFVWYASLQTPRVSNTFPSGHVKNPLISGDLNNELLKIWTGKINTNISILLYELENIKALVFNVKNISKHFKVF